MPESEPDRPREIALRREAERALALPPAARLEALLHGERPMRLVRTLAATDFYLTVREVGPADALPLLALADARQLRHLLDLEAWRGDRFDADRAGAWLAVVLESGEPAARRLLRALDDEVLTLLLQRWVRLEAIESESGPQIRGPGESGSELGAVTPDGEHRFSPSIPDHRPVIGRLLRLLYADAPERYARLMSNARWELGSEIEEQALHWRRSRLEEQGFPGSEEAFAVYAPPTGTRTHPAPPEPEEPGALPAPRSPLSAPEARRVLARAVARLADADRDRALHELAAVANKLMVADGADPGDPEAHRGAADRAAAYIGLALEKRGALEDGAAADALREVPAVELFREGWALASELGRRARELLRRGWPAGSLEALELLDSPLRDQIEALLAPRPRHVELHADGPSIVRDFRTLAEIEQARAALELAEIVGKVLVERLGTDRRRLAEAGGGQRPEPARFSTVLATLLAWHAARGELRGEPLESEVAADFLRNVVARRTAAPDAGDRALGALQDRLAEQLSLSVRERAVLSAFGRFCLERLEGELGGLDPGVPLDPRFVATLLLNPPDGSAR